MTRWQRSIEQQTPRDDGSTDWPASNISRLIPRKKLRNRLGKIE